MRSAICNPQSQIGKTSAPRPLYPVLLFFTLFLGCIVGAWAWFNLPQFKVQSSEFKVQGSVSGIHFQPRPTVPGYVFVPERLDATVYQTLGTTNIINGAFMPVGPSEIGDQGPAAGTQRLSSQLSTLKPQRTTDPGPLTSDEIPHSAFRIPHSNGPQPSTHNPQRALTLRETPRAATGTVALPIPHSSVRVFLASWRPEDGRKTVSILHTPDICWRLAGWSTLSLGQPPQAWLSVDGRQLPMQSRLFGSPGGADREFVMWCTLVDGRPLETPGRAAASSRAASDTGRASASGRADAEISNDVEIPPPGAPGARRPTQFMASQHPADNGGESSPLKYDLASRRIIAQEVWELLKRRTAVSGSKQFLRVSVPLATDWQTALNQINSFVPTWLKL
ncbi:MAG: hypothetical protein ACYDH9_24065 [Limisphaerales bacterium]